MDYFKRGIEILNPDVEFFPISCTTGEGVDSWVNWLKNRIEQFQKNWADEHHIPIVTFITIVIYRFILFCSLQAEGLNSTVATFQHTFLRIVPITNKHHKSIK